MVFFQGDKTIDVSKTHLGFPYIINFCNLTQVRCCTGYVRPIRRVQQAPYPLVKVALEELRPPVAAVTRNYNSPKGFSYMPPIFKNPSVKQSHKKTGGGGNGKKANGNGKKQSKQGENGTSNIARVILNNIFGGKHVNIGSSNSNNNNNAVASGEGGQTRKANWEGVLDVDSSSTKSGRRPSVDTVSTYLSHENPVDLLDSSVGSDEAFKDNSVIGSSIFIFLS